MLNKLNEKNCMGSCLFNNRILIVIDPGNKYE